MEEITVQELGEILMELPGDLVVFTTDGDTLLVFDESGKYQIGYIDMVDKKYKEV